MNQQKERRTILEALPEEPRKKELLWKIFRASFQREIILEGKPARRKVCLGRPSGRPAEEENQVCRKTDLTRPIEDEAKAFPIKYVTSEVTVGDHAHTTEEPRKPSWKTLLEDSSG